MQGSENYRKSTFSYANGNCVEVGEEEAGEDWRKSTRSADGNCVEAGNGASTVLVRDTKNDGRGPVLRFAPGGWQAFLSGVRNGEFDKFGGTP